ncbi:MAG TPA: hypothetical protein VFX64_02550 [Candidatus Nitrosotalea sp.]|nr:hypothetical protein [Candidatus Nitrosotalea sp.]
MNRATKKQAVDDLTPEEISDIKQYEVDKDKIIHSTLEELLKELR